MLNLRAVAAFAAVSALCVDALTFASSVAASPSCIPDVPFQMLNNINGGKDICSSLLGITTPVRTQTIQETAYTTEVFTAETPFVTNVVVETSTDVQIVSLPASTVIVTILEKRVDADPTIPPHIDALGMVKISSACSCVVTTPDSVDVTATITKSLYTSVFTTPATVTVDVTSTTQVTVTNTVDGEIVSVPTSIPSACAQGYQALINPGFQDSDFDIRPWTASEGYGLSGLGETPPSINYYSTGDFNGDFLIQQRINTCPGKRYNFQVKFTSTAIQQPEVTCEIHASLDFAVFAMSQPFTTVDRPIDAYPWPGFSGSVVAQANRSVFRMEVRCYGSRGNRLFPEYLVYLDDFSFVAE